MSDFQCFEETPRQITEEIVELGRQHNLEMEDANNNELIASLTEKLSNF
jgi:hypothetical protein